jgi:hypothetical protein
MILRSSNAANVGKLAVFVHSSDLSDLYMVCYVNCLDRFDPAERIFALYYKGLDPALSDREEFQVLANENEIQTSLLSLDD